MDSNHDFNTLAYIGDVLYELRIRLFFLDFIPNDIKRLHSKVVDYVCGKKQVEIMHFMKDSFFDEEEIDFLRRSRNNKKTGKSPAEKKATAFEALIGLHYINGNNNRVDEIFKTIEDFIRIEEGYEKRQEQKR
jgi:ribonuclease-3 family protein